MISTSGRENVYGRLGVKIKEFPQMLAAAEDVLDFLKCIELAFIIILFVVLFTIVFMGHIIAYFAVYIKSLFLGQACYFGNYILELTEYFLNRLRFLDSQGHFIAFGLFCRRE